MCGTIEGVFSRRPEVSRRSYRAEDASVERIKVILETCVSMVAVKVIEGRQTCVTVGIGSIELTVLLVDHRVVVRRASHDTLARSAHTQGFSKGV